MEYESLLVDSNLIISFFCEKDTNYPKAQRLLEETQNFYSILTTNYIHLEFATVLSQKLGKPSTTRALRLLDSLGVKEVFVDQQTHTKTKEEFEEETRKDISFVDISTAIIAKKRGIKEILTLDQHFKYLGEKYGFKVIGV